MKLNKESKMERRKEFQHGNKKPFNHQGKHCTVILFPPDIVSLFLSEALNFRRTKVIRIDPFINGLRFRLQRSGHLKLLMKFTTI